MSSKLITKEELKKIRVCDDNEVFKFFEQSDNDGVTLLFQSARRYTRGIPSKLVVLYKRHHQDFWVLTIRSMSTAIVMANIVTLRQMSSISQNCIVVSK